MDTALFLVGKLVGLLVRVESWIILLAMVCLLAQIAGRARLALGATVLLTGALVGLTVMPMGGLLLRPLEATYAMDPDLGEVAGIIVLGGSEDVAASALWGGAQLRESGERLTATAALARRFPTARVLLLGAGGRLRDVGGVALSEAQVAARFLLAQGIDPARLVLEERSRNTAENARLGRAIVGPGTGQRWVLVTSASHMPRAVQSFAAAGWSDVVPYPVDFRSGGFADGIGWNLGGNLDQVNVALREWVGRLGYGLIGR